MRANKYDAYPICDTDVWVNACLGGIENKLISKYTCIVMADVVAQEISAWKSSESKYSFIYSKFQEYVKQDKIIVIHHTEICDEDKQILEMQLYEYSFSSGFENDPKEKNKGEIVSAIYAEHFEISILVSNDGAFKKDGDAYEKFDIEIKDWNEITDILIMNFKEKVRVRRIVEERQKAMKKERLKLEGKLA